MPFSIKTFLEELAAGAVRAFGAPDAKPAIVDHPDGKRAFLLVRDGYKPQELPGREVAGRAHAFADVETFAQWVKREATRAKTIDSCDILVDVDNLVAVAALRPTDPHADRVRCDLAWHPRASRWFDLFGQPRTQRVLHQFVLGALEDFPPAQTAKGEDAGNYGEWLAGQLAKLEVAQGQNLTVQLDERGTVLFAAADAKTQVNGRLPARLKVRVPGIVGVPGEYELEILLRLTVPKEGSPIFTLECPSLPVVQRQAALDAVAHLRGLLGEGFLVGVGAAAFTTVPVVRS